MSYADLLASCRARALHEVDRIKNHGGQWITHDDTRGSVDITAEMLARFEGEIVEIDTLAQSLSNPDEPQEPR